ncbi:fatty acyl-AMP ligase [Streptomyces somaliensis DSM 40738]|uniref:Fatty acyl-AMP ligase n=1 Tax=Streptomyces somaliensis (strain ATCC 33201 / DSM 40738 / JCM 12659 / KCTC 9044 / NCTC 11332 / NRRL B-12077 / IP 733) TaxID=1134445 RepID=A0AA44ICJ6_STRE0|nr:fatty acyl-AMP ligase [Streptomyces somaliensis]MCQ0025251.1 fatty acyl-AMP ligase [Streptomyces somaliensis DSM 40738]NKY13749.1 fatty acyl-AMP ligase [Streptomyces somaliensis DSM 40738]
MEPFDHASGASLVHVLDRRARRTPDRLAFRFLADGTGDHLVDRTYADLAARTEAVAARLRERGVDGGRVVLALDPGPDYVAALFGVMRAGCTAVPCFPPSGRRAVARFLSVVTDCAPAAVLTDARFADRVEDLHRALPAAAGRPRWLFPDGGFFLDRPETGVPPRVVGPALLQYTSGSTGDPKGIVLEHGHLLSNCRVLEKHIGYEEDRVGCSWLPPYHDMGLMGTIMLAVHGGWPLVMMSPLHFVQDPYRWLKAISDHRATITVAPNFAFDLCASTVGDEELAALDLSTLRQVFCGSEPVSGATLDRFRERFGPACGFDLSSVIPCYGLAEATLFVSGKPPGAPGVPAVRLDREALERGEVRRTGDRGAGTAVEVVSCGTIAHGHDVLVVDPDSRRPVPPGRVGELWVTGPNVATGYHDRPALTAAVFRARPEGAADGPGHLRTGDLGFLLDGELFVTGRLKDLIVVSGRNLHPQDIEESVARTHPAMRRAAAFSVRGTARDEEEVVVVAEYRATPREFAANGGELRERVIEAVTADHGVRPAAVHLGPPGTVLTTTSGKVRRAATRTAYLSGALKAFAPVPERAGAVPS